MPDQPLRVALVLPHLHLLRSGPTVRTARLVELLHRHRQLEVFTTLFNGWRAPEWGQARRQARELGFRLHAELSCSPTFRLLTPRNAWVHCAEALIDSLCVRHAAQPFDAILVSSSIAGRGLFRWQNLRPRPALLLEEHNIESRLLVEMRRVRAYNPDLRLREWPRRWLYERRLWRLVDRVIAISPQERETIADWTPRQVVWIPIAVPLEAPVERRPEPATLLFVGGLWYAPNVAAARLLALQVLPRVQRRFPHVRLELVGRNPCPEVLALAGGPVSVHGDVPEVTSYLSRATLAVQPVFHGAGAKIKTLEALNAQVCLAVSRHAAEPWGIEHRRHALVFDDAAACAASVIELLDQPTLRARLVAGGRKLAEQFEPARIDQLLLRELYACVAECRSRAAREHREAGSAPTQTRPHRRPGQESVHRR